MPGKRARRQQRALKRRRDSESEGNFNVKGSYSKVSGTTTHDFEADSSGQPLDDIEPEEDSYEGIVHQGHMFLADKKTNILYDSIRDEQGSLMPVGVVENGSVRFSTYDWMLPELESHEGETFAFTVTDDNDHCETGIKAYLDIKPALESLTGFLRLERDKLRLWDPYYCTGRVKRRLLKIGFPSVHNENEDFYALIRDRHLPSYDVLITNPPYSQDHIPKLLNYCLNDSKPSFLLVPTYVLRKGYFNRILDANVYTIFLAPQHGRYSYHSPKFSRIKTGRTAPFKTIWILCCKTSEMHDMLLKNLNRLQKAADWAVFSSPNDIPARYFDDNL